MLDIQLFRDNPKKVKKICKDRFCDESFVDIVIDFDEKWRNTQQKVQSLKHKKNTVSLEINELKKQGKNAKSKIKEMREVAAKIKKLDLKITEYEEKRDKARKRIPNLIDKTTPIAKTEDGNKVLKKHGKKPKFSFKPKSHTELLEALNLGDTEHAAKVSGSRFFFLKNELALLDIALQRFALDFLSSKGFTILQTPMLVNQKTVDGTVDFEAFADQMYKIEGEDLYLVSTAELPLVGYYMDQAIPEDSLPIRFAGISSCFRKEAGAHGKDTKGIFRVHQFNKVEQVVFCTPETSEKEFKILQKNAEELFNALEIPYRVVNVASGDMSKKAILQYDIEAWFPTQNKYRELGSCSNVWDYQARALNTKVIRNKDGKREVLHTLNNTGIATTRTMTAILENCQQKDSSIKIPKVLWPYMNGIKTIKPQKK